MREFPIKLIFSLIFISAIFAIVNSVYADCDATPDPQATGDCTATTIENTPNRIECCDRLYPPGSTDAQGGSTELAHRLCVRRKKTNAEDAKKLHESFTNQGPTGQVQSGRLPIIFLPGVAGSTLKSGGYPVWPAAIGLSDRSHLELNPQDGRSSLSGVKVEADNIFRSGAGQGKNFYGDLIDSLAKIGYQENTDLIIFPYDWRCDNSSHFKHLDEVIDKTLSATGKSKVILIAHSMGGLIARGYVYSGSVRAAKVDSFITIGTPYWGAPKVFYATVHGYDFDNPFIQKETMKILMRNFPVSYQLMPQKPFVKDTKTGSEMALDEIYKIQYKWFDNVHYSLTDSYSLKSNNGQSLNTVLLKMAKAFYTSVGEKSNPRALPPGVKQYVIIGCNIATLSGYELIDVDPSQSSYLEIGNRKVEFRPVPEDGDGSVPVWSAETDAATQTYYVPYVAGFASPLFTDWDVSSEHGALPANQTVQSIVARILQGTPPQQGEYPAPQRYQGTLVSTPPKRPGVEAVTEFLLHSDAHLRISNERGRVLGFNNKEVIQETLPGTFLDMDGLEYAALFDSADTYKVEVTGIREGKFTLDLNVKKNGTKYAFSYPEVVVKKGTVASLSLTPNQVPPAPEMTVTTDGQTSRVSPKVGSGTPSSSSTSIPIPEGAGFSRELNTTFTGNTPILRYYVLNDAFPDQCQADCAKDAACAAYTYVKPGGYKAGDPPICYLFSGLGPKVASDCCISGARNSQAPPPRATKACDYSMTEAIYKKWTELGSGEGKLGCPISGETKCGPSVKNTSCHLIQFKKDDGGYLLQHTSGPLSGKVFDVSGCMFKLYYQLNGPKSWLGLPTSDGYVTPPGSRQDFENGYILWDSKTWACTAYNVGTPPPPQTQADVATPPRPPGSGWVRKGFGDCSGRDIGGTEGSAVPADSYCTAETAGQTAVCWDGQIKHHPNGKIWCTYKNVLAENCTGGSAPGFVYQCSSPTGPPKVPPRPPVTVSPPPPVISTPAPPPSPPQQTVVSPTSPVWRFVETQEHGLLNEGGPLPPEDGNMVFSQVSYDTNGGQFVLTINTARIWCGQGNDTETVLVKWRFNSDIRVLRPGDTIPITIELTPQKLGNLCPYSGLWNTEIVTAWSGHGDYFPQSEKGKYWDGFTQPKEAPGRRFNFYVHRDDPSTSSGTPELMVNAGGIPGATDPQYGWFAITVRGGCCLTKVASQARGNVGNERRNHAFYYIYKFEGK